MSTNIQAPLLLSSTVNDSSAPFSYKLWLTSRQGITPGQEFKQYNEYLVNWFNTKANTATDSKIQLKLNYLTLLKQLQLFFSKEEAENWYNNIDINNEKELLLSIPYFARKLKDISLYYRQLRQNIKEARISYNQAGTNTGIIRQIQKLILAGYTKKQNASITLPHSIWKTVPSLSTVKDSLVVEIEEMYDSHHYFDQSPTMPVSAYYDTTNEELQKFLTSKNLSLTSTDWIYKIGVNPLSADYIDNSDIDLTPVAAALAEKYLSQDKYTSVPPATSLPNDFYTVYVENGRNFFYWPSFTYESKALTLPRYKPISIHSLNLETLATAGSSLETADTLFVKSAAGIQGAWLRNIYYDYSTPVMEATIDPNTKTVFRFPFPGFGLSGDDSTWTGFQFKTDNRYRFLADDVKNDVLNAYWTTTTGTTSITPIPINDSTLIANKAFAHKNYTHADKLKYWSVTPAYTDVSFSGDEKECWLYRMDKTDIPIKPEEDTVIYWPYEQINTAQEFPQYYPKNINDVCKPIPVSAVNFTYATAYDSLSGADLIFKINNYLDTANEAVECCWLSGKRLEYPQEKATAVQQSTLQMTLCAGNYHSFIWNGADYTDANNVFKPVKHQPDCKYINTKNASYLDSSQCNCNAVYFTPFGHQGNTFNEYESLADFIVEDTFSPGNFDISSWSSSSTKYITSSAFGYFKTTAGQGWYDGTWRTGDKTISNKLYLRKNKKYVYYRANIKKNNIEEHTLPNYILRYDYNTYNAKRNTDQAWIRAIKNDDGDWVSANTPTEMVLYPGDLLLYSRAKTTSINLTGVTPIQVDINENKGSIWSNFDYLSISKNKQIIVSYPQTVYAPVSTYNSTDFYKQYPVANGTNVLQVLVWSLTSPDRSVQTFRNTPYLLFTPALTGLYMTAVTAVTGIPNNYTSNGSYANSGIYVFSNIPPVTAISTTDYIPTLTSIETPIPGYVLNTPLEGWNYNTAKAEQFVRAGVVGAKPFWAKAYTEKDANTKYGGINTVGNVLRFVNGYNAITQPEFSDIKLEIGSKIEYTRNYQVNFTWIQPLDLNVYVNEKKWSTLEFTTTGESNIAHLLNNIKNELVVIPTTATSDIYLQNFVDNKPVEVYYNSVNSFIWNITATPLITNVEYQNVQPVKIIEAYAPWANLSNNFYPTFAAFPAFEDLYSAADKGGFFTPSNLGATIYTNQDFSTSLQLSSNSLLGYFNSSVNKVAGRGLTKEDQHSPFEITLENSSWLKEPTTSGPTAGTIKKDIFKKYQKFIPYQSGYETNPRIRVGLVTPTSRQTPWTGKEDSEWFDSSNYPKSFTGELNVSKWTNAQVLKQAGLQIDNWVTDIFGNQYGLYKELDGVSTNDRKNITGEIWVRKNSQRVSPGYESLSAVFDTYTNTTIINQLTGKGIKKIDMFFDTMLIETSGALIFEKINYNYDTDSIFSLTDEARYISLAMPVSTNFAREFNKSVNLSTFRFAKAGETWFIPSTKKVYVSTCGVTNFILTPELYEVDIDTHILRKVFPTLTSDNTIIRGLSSQFIAQIDPPVLSYNSLKKQYLFALSCKNNTGKSVVLEFKLKNSLPIEIDTLTVYTPNVSSTKIEPPVIHQTLLATATIDNKFTFQCVANNTPVYYTGIDLPNWLELSSTGLFTGTPANSGTYLASFKVTNNAGPSYYSLNITVQ